MNSFRSALDKGRLGTKGGPMMPEKKPSGANEAAGLGSVAVPRDATRSANHRDADRHRLTAEQAELKVGRKKHVVDLVNLSGGGAMIRTDVALDMWQKVTLVLGESDALECAVRWIRNDRVGLEFAHETQIAADPDKYHALLLDVLHRSFPDLRDVSTPDVEPCKMASQPVDMSRRDSIRHPLIWSGQIHYDYDTVDVRLRNVSEQGVLVDCPRDFPENAEVLLDLGGAGQHFATVSWSRGDQAGLHFNNPFDVSLLAQARPQVADHRWTPPSYLKGMDSAASDEGWNAATLNELRDDLEGYMKR